MAPSCQVGSPSDVVLLLLLGRTGCQPAGSHQHVDGIAALRVAYEQEAAGRGRRKLTVRQGARAKLHAATEGGFGEQA